MKSLVTSAVGWKCDSSQLRKKGHPSPMRFKWLILSIFSFVLACVLGYKLDSEQLRTTLLTVINGSHAQAATRPEEIGSVSDGSQAFFPMAINVNSSGAANSLSKISFESEILRGSLIKAVRTDNSGLTKKIVKLGADVNSRTSANGWSALHYAVRNGNAEIVQLLLKAGADPNCLGTIEGQKNSAAPVKPLVLAQAALDLVSQVPPSSIEETLHQGGLDDPALVKSMKAPNAAERYRTIVDVLTNAKTKL